MQTTPLTTAERNLWFATLKPAAQRVAIAREVLSLLKAKKLVPKRENVYLSAKVKEGTTGPIGQAELGAGTCTVCAVGALFAGLICGFDGVTVNPEKAHKVRITPRQIKTALDGIFHPAQLDLIESAFESSWAYAFNEKLIRQPLAPGFFPESLSARKRLVAIMENIIANHGEFIILEGRERRGVGTGCGVPAAHEG